MGFASRSSTLLLLWVNLFDVATKKVVQVRRDAVMQVIVLWHFEGHFGFDTHVFQKCPNAANAVAVGRKQKVFAVPSTSHQFPDEWVNAHFNHFDALAVRWRHVVRTMPDFVHVRVRGLDVRMELPRQVAVRAFDDAVIHRDRHAVSVWFL